MVGKRGRQPLRIVNGVAPIRICDNGGWTDTWFAEYGKIFNIGVYPYAEVQIEVYPYDGGEDRIVLRTTASVTSFTPNEWAMIGTRCWRRPLTVCASLMTWLSR